MLRETNMTMKEASQMIDYLVNDEECPICYDYYMVSYD